MWRTQRGEAARGLFYKKITPFAGLHAYWTALVFL